MIHFGEISRSMSYLEISHFGPKFVPRFPTILSQFNCEKSLEISHFGPYVPRFPMILSRARYFEITHFGANLLLVACYGPFYELFDEN